METEEGVEGGAFHSHYRHDSGLGIKCPLSNSLENLEGEKKEEGGSRVIQILPAANRATQNVSSHPRHANTASRRPTVISQSQYYHTPVANSNVMYTQREHDVRPAL